MRMRTKMPLDLYHEVIGNFHKNTDTLYLTKMGDYLESFPKKDVIFEAIKREVL